MSRLGLTRVGACWWIQVVGSLKREDMHNLAVLIGDLGTRPPSNVILDLSRVRHLDYKGGHLLVAAARLVRLRGGDVTVTGVSPYVWNLLKLGVAQECEELLGELDGPSRSGIHSNEVSLVFMGTDAKPGSEQPLGVGPVGPSLN